MDRYQPPPGLSVADWLDTFVPHLSIDCVIFGFHQSDLKLLLLKWSGASVWVLPGGFVRHADSVDAAARRVLQARTGLRSVHLCPFHVFGELDRREAFGRRLFQIHGADVPRNHWVFRRVVSLGYYALVDFEKVTPTPDAWSDSCVWCPLDAHPPLAFDHERIVSRAHESLRAAFDQPGTGANLLPERFTMRDLQRLHEAILGRRFDRRNFQKRMVERGGLECLDERRRGGAHRAPRLYRFSQTAS